ncbi:MAG: type IV toxin-antitoxin system AbiEi family antitoxin domain-containing protein [Candidatus Freyarchaeota archaeon]
MKLYEVKDRVLAGGRLVLSVAQLSNLMAIPRSHAKVHASRLVERGFAWRVRRGVISFTDDPFVVASQLVEPSYASFTAALYLRGLVDQVPAVVECVTTRGSFEFERLGIRYRKVHPSLFFGYERVERQGSYAHVAKPAKAVLDMVYFGAYPESLRVELDGRELASMAEAYKRVGGFRARRVLRWVVSRAK